MKRNIEKAKAAKFRTLQIGPGCWTAATLENGKIIDRKSGKVLSNEEAAPYRGDQLAKNYLNGITDWLSSKGWLDSAYIQLWDESFDPEGSHNAGAPWGLIKDTYIKYRKIEPRMNYLGLTAIHPDMQGIFDIWAPMITFHSEKSNDMIERGISLRGPKTVPATVTASSCGGGSPLYYCRPIDAYDGFDYTAWVPENSPSAAKPQWLQLSFDKEEDISGVRIVPYATGHYSGSLLYLNVEISNDGSTFRKADIASISKKSDNGEEIVKLNTTRCKAVRLTWSEDNAQFTADSNQPIVNPVREKSPVGVREVEIIKDGSPSESELARANVKPAIMWEYSVDADYPSSCVDADPAEVRALGWLMWQRDLAGYLNYGAGQWQLFGDKPVLRPTDVDPMVWPSSFSNGGEFIVYPGKDEVLPSIRFARFRDGLEDNDYLHILQRRNPSSPLLKAIRNSGRYYYQNSANMTAMRAKIANALAGK